MTGVPDKIKRDRLSRSSPHFAEFVIQTPYQQLLGEVARSLKDSD